MSLPVLHPMTATPASTLPSGPAWTYEVKWDGYRALAYKDGKRVRLLSRNLKDFTTSYQTIAAAAGALQAKTAVLDSEFSVQLLHRQKR